MGSSSPRLPTRRRRKFSAQGLIMRTPRLAPSRAARPRGLDAAPAHFFARRDDVWWIEYEHIAPTGVGERVGVRFEQVAERRRALRPAHPVRLARRSTRRDGVGIDVRRARARDVAASVRAREQGVGTRDVTASSTELYAEFGTRARELVVPERGEGVDEEEGVFRGRVHAFVRRDLRHGGEIRR